VALLYFDCFSGAAGDMILGALIDVGVPLDDLRRALGTLTIEPGAVWTERVVRAGIVATKFCVRGENGTRDSLGSGSSHAHPHRHLKKIYELIDRSALSDSARHRAKALFERLAEAEAAIHGTSLDRVHLHEVGALDSIIDIVGAVFALEWLGIDDIVASPLNVGSGTVHVAHGNYPVPAPATTRLLQGSSIYAGAEIGELVTPTGALVISSYAKRYGPVPPMRLHKVGYGAGTRDLGDTPNVLRVLVGESDRSGVALTVTVIECEIDDMNPQIFGVLMDRLLTEGALDVFYTAVQMKKNRPGTLLTIIASPDRREALTALVFRETTTIGVRYRDMLRECLERDTITVDTPLGPARVKVSRRGTEVLNVSPEFDDCVRLASAGQLPLKDVQGLVMHAYVEGRIQSSESKD
jgi:uncharacterized protein (TIGR00299 family) protein